MTSATTPLPPPSAPSDEMPPADARPRRLERDPDGVLGGVASGLAHYFDIDVSLMRLAFILSFLLFGVGPILYPLAWLIVPKADHPLRHQPTYTPPAAA